MSRSVHVRVPFVLLCVLAACGTAPAEVTTPEPVPAPSAPIGGAEATPAATPEPTPASASVTPEGVDVAPVPASASSAAVATSPVAMPPAKPAVKAGPAATTPEPAKAKTDPAPETPTAAPPATPAPQPVAPVAAPVPTRWTLNAGKSHVFVVSRIDTGTLFSSLGHDHAIGATRFTGDATWGEGVPCAVDIVVPVNDLKVDPPGYRKMAGIDLAVDMKAEDKATIEANFKGKKQLDADKYPDIRFKAKSCSGTTGSVSVTGDFTMHGVTRSITVPMKVSVDATTFKANGRFSIKGSDYNMPPYSAPMGALKNLDKLDFTLDVVGTPKN